jgi:RNA polymerase sigma-70 factor (ECF subfamily)
VLAFAALAEAHGWMQEGRGAELMQIDLGPLGKALYSARHLVSLRGPETRSAPFQNIAKVRVPILMETSRPNNEPALIEGSQAGDPAAMEELVRTHQARVYTFAMRMCRNVEDAKDILQETFLGMLRSIRDFRGESRFTTWLYRIASNACLKKRRRGVHDPEPGQEISLDDLMPRPAPDGRRPEIADWSEDAERALLRGELTQQMEAAIDRLPREYKIVLVLRDVEGFSAEETAQMLNLSVPAVKSRLHRARVFVRRDLAQYFQDTPPP